MNKLLPLFLSALTLCAAPAMAHIGHESLDQHFIEPILIVLTALSIAIPVGYGLLRILKRGDTHR